jgi:hypothetical protein
MATSEWVAVTKYLQRLEGHKPSDRCLIIKNQGTMSLMLCKRNVQFIFNLSKGKITMTVICPEDDTDHEGTRRDNSLHYHIKGPKDAERHMKLESWEA